MPLRMSLPECGEGARGIPRGGALRYWHPLKGGGDIKLSVGILSDGTVKGIETLTITETAGLGMKAAEPEFKDQFKDKQVEKFSYTKTGEEGDDKIDALSGATITTNAVTNAVDSALVYFQSVLGGSVNE